MKALFYMGPGKLELKTVNDPTGEGSVIVKILEAGICGTDLKTYLRGHHMFKPPVVLGHECYGVVVEAPDFIGKIKVGDYVVVAPYAECGICEKCRRGFPELCEKKTFIPEGCFAQYVRVPIEHAVKGLFKIDGAISRMVLAEPLACVLGALRKIPNAGRILVVGGGVMGSLFGRYLTLRGVEVRIVEPAEWRYSFLRSLGLDVVKPPVSAEREYDAVVIASTIDDPFSYLSSIRDGGALVLFGGYPKNAKLELDPFHIHYREISIVGSFGYALADFAKAVEELRTNESYSDLITHIYHIDDFEKAFQKALSRECMKVTLRMWDDEKEKTS